MPQTDRSTLTGGCACGAIRYALEETPRNRVYCHCESCRRAAGAWPVAWCSVAPAAWRLLSGELRRRASSPGVERGFCGACGTQLTYFSADEPGDLDVTIGSLDTPLKPTAHIWVQDAPPDSLTEDSLPRFATASR